MAATVATKKVKMSRMARREAVVGFFFISPWIIGFLIFVLYALGHAFYISMTDWNLLTTPNFIGLRNYIDLFRDPRFIQSVRVTLTFAGVSVPLNIAVGLSIALMLNQNIKPLGFWRTLYYFPSIISGIAVAMMWLWVFNPDFGIINYLLSIIGIRGPGWLACPNWALPSIMLMGVWAAGGGMVIYLAGLQGIPTELYESASIDGANALSRFRRITIPMMTPVLFYNLIIGIIAALQTFVPAFIMTGGGPNNATLFYGLFLYENAFSFWRMGYAAAMGWLLFLFALVITIILFKTSSSWVFYASSDSDGR